MVYSVGCEIRDSVEGMVDVEFSGFAALDFGLQVWVGFRTWISRVWG